MIEAIGFRVVIRPDPVVETTKSGIYLAVDEKLEKGATVVGTVVQIGPEAFRSYNRSAGFTQYVPWVNVGDRVHYARYAGKWVEDPYTKEEFLVVNDEDIVDRIINDVAAEAPTDQAAS